MIRIVFFAGIAIGPPNRRTSKERRVTYLDTTKAGRCFHLPASSAIPVLRGRWRAYGHMKGASPVAGNDCSWHMMNDVAPLRGSLGGVTKRMMRLSVAGHDATRPHDMALRV